MSRSRETNEPNSPTCTQLTGSEDLVGSSDTNVAEIGTDVAAVQASLSRVLEMDIEADKQSQDAAVTNTVLSRPSLDHRAPMFDYADAVLAPNLEATLRKALREARAADREAALKGVDKGADA